jgi:CubicO group peptidase (beta-lactamase class C family)
VTADSPHGKLLDDTSRRSTVTVDKQAWQQWLDSGIRAARVPGASLSILADGETTTVASGLLSRSTHVDATVDSIWQIGSITKVFTTTQIMQLIGDGQLTLDTKVVEVLPDFRVADPDVTKEVEVRHLLTHTSGIDGDVVVDAGRGDDAVARYVAALADVVQLHPLGAMLSYCNSGWVVAGRIVEVLTGQPWDQALVDRIIDPLGLRHTVVLPEDALLHRTAVGHIARFGTDPDPVPAWGFSRSWGPANQITASADDVMAFARMHLDGGRNAAGDEVLPPDLVREMQQPRADMDNPSRRVDHLGLGWWLCDWGGATVYGHDGNTLGQSSFLRVDPASKVAVVLLTNGRTTAGLVADLFGRVFGELAGLTVPIFAPPDDPIEVDTDSVVGVYGRGALRITVTAAGGGLRASVQARRSGPNPPDQIDLVAVSEDVWALQSEPGGPWKAWSFLSLPDGSRYVHDGLQVTPKLS